MEVDSTNNNNENAPTTNSKTESDGRYNVELTRAIKENHGCDIREAIFCPFEGGEAYFATCGGNQVNVYDCNVRGNYISTLLNYRNWHLQTMKNRMEQIKANYEKKHPDALALKSFNSICWMRRYRDFYIAAADNESQIHILSMVQQKCIKIIKTSASVVALRAHAKYPNVLCTIDTKNECKFINIGDEKILYSLPDKALQIRFSPSHDRFCVVLTNGNIREYLQKVEIVKDDDAKQDDDGNGNGNGKSKRFVIRALKTYKFEGKGGDISDFIYFVDNVIIVGNEEGEFRQINMDNLELQHQWKAVGPLEHGNVCKFALNEAKDCMVYGNAAHQVQIYDLKKKKYLRRIDTARGRKMPFSFASFCPLHPHSIMMVTGCSVYKYDPFELVKEYFPSTADFAHQFRNGIQLFTQHRSVEYEVDKMKQ